jgi:trans-2,3-dihydro-3-hydroxyanthranilate isomerase
MRLTIVDVFAENRYEGNQLAVVEDAGHLDDAAMQTIAKEMNFSETTFVTSVTEDGADVRIFTPAEEMPFAGHPTLGTAWVLARDRAGYELRLPGGDVDISFSDGLVWMVPPPAELRAGIDPVTAAGLAGITPDQLDADRSPRLVYSGAEYCLVPVRSRAVLESIAPDLEAIRALSPGGALFTVCTEAHTEGADFAVRMHFFDGAGLREDPATGSANTAFALYLRESGLQGELVVEQGFEVGRPSRLYLEIGEQIRVGGRVQLVAEGQLVAD